MSVIKKITTWFPATFTRTIIQIIIYRNKIIKMCLKRDKNFSKKKKIILKLGQATLIIILLCRNIVVLIEFLPKILK